MCLPDILSLSDNKQDNIRIALDFFQRNILNKRFSYDGRKINFEYEPTTSIFDISMPESMWHVSGEKMVNNIRAVKLKRLEKIPWIPWVIKNILLCRNIKHWWEDTNKKGIQKLYLLFDNLEYEIENPYVIILIEENRRNSLRLVTAYNVDRRHNLETFRTRHKEYVDSQYQTPKTCANQCQ